MHRFALSGFLLAFVLACAGVADPSSVDPVPDAEPSPRQGKKRDKPTKKPQPDRKQGPACTTDALRRPILETAIKEQRKGAKLTKLVCAGDDAFAKVKLSGPRLDTQTVVLAVDAEAWTIVGMSYEIDPKDWCPEHADEVPKAICEALFAKG